MKTKILLIAAIAMLLASCKTTKIATITNHEKIERSTEVSKTIDSIFVYVQDSTIIRTVGDTVFCDRWKIRYRDRIKVDTLIKTDTLIVVNEKIETKVEVKKEPSGFQWFQIWLGRVLSVIFILQIIWFVILFKASKVMPN
jgi:hypothetical protein